MNAGLQRAPGSQLLRRQPQPVVQTRILHKRAAPVQCAAAGCAGPAAPQRRAARPAAGIAAPSSSASSSGLFGSSSGAPGSSFSVADGGDGGGGCARRRGGACRAADAALPLPGGADAPAAAAPGGLSRLLANVRALAFALWTFTLAIPLFIAMTAMSPVVMLTDKFRRLAQHFVNNLWAIASTTPFYGVTIVGRENLPPAGSPAVYIANHQSFMDIYSLFHLQRPFKFISKTSNFMIPIALFARANAPLRQVGFMCFMMWMMGNGIQIFSIIMTLSGLAQPITAILKCKEAFPSDPAGRLDTFTPRLIYCAIQFGQLLFVLNKLNSMGLLPTHASDWMASLPVPPAAAVAVRAV
ncbi:1-acyl-sn-glycerol-3-phosphate acyltransferase [Raphidocelis subcapitata]|uniref:ER membrane protein complex subunit 4 n=1 Tax=Raphidocelis subcapitata TaxID=307507 RepID=A0A2V0NKY0_9CHLO|nr:1-acyl-sn-glycerol-3-phosphate acyltransferase [Raphidocelis subcapitata]|eukprot:GBF88021.1 1-acyl-sn-glycerol-3-phosphate acyltransferase [Raphidocelis subcapitata]